MVWDILRNVCRRGLTGTFIAIATAAGAASISVEAEGQYVPPAGYTKTELQPMVPGPGGKPIPIVADNIGVSSSGQLVVFTASTSTLTLYNSWQNLQTPSETISNPAWQTITDLAFVGPSKVVFGENTTDTAWNVNFSNTMSPATQYPGTFPSIEGVAAVNSNTVLLSGTTADFGSTGGFYLDTLNLTTGASTPLVSNVGTGYVGGTGVTAAGHAVLLDTGSDSGIARVYDLSNGNSIRNVDLADGGGSGAYAMTFDSAGDAFITTGGTLTEITGIDSTSPGVSPFGFFAEGDYAFPTGIGFTGGSFLPGDSMQTGALIVNGEFTGDGGLFAITSIPEPATSAGMLGALAISIVLRRRRACTVGGHK